MQASGPILKQYPLKGTSDPTRKKWLQQLPVETQQEATKFAKMFQDAAVPKAKLQEAAIQYGLRMEQSLKFPPRGLQQLIAIAAALTAWLVISWREWLPLKLFEVFNHLRQFLKYLYTSCSHNPEVSWDVGVESAPRFCVVLFSFSSFGITKVEVEPRVQRTHFFTALGVVWRQIRGAAIGSQISPTLSNLAVALIERSWSSTYQEVLTQPNFHHLAIRYVDNRFVIVQKHHLQAPVFKVFTWTFMVVQSNWSWLPTIYFSAFMLIWKNSHLQVTRHSPNSGQCFSRNPPTAFERTEESSSFNS